jgi:hypothetical protein
MDTRKLTKKEMDRLVAGLGVTDLVVTCEADTGTGPCGTYLEWTDGRCACGHKIEIAVYDCDDKD